ncbi:MAG TPA: PKD domain-containing protein [Solirubrobacteraceae bacterium]
MMRRHSLTARRVIIAIASTLIASLAVVASAPALVVNDSGTQAGVTLIPTSRGGSLPGGVSAVTSSSSCTDPWLAADLGGPNLPNDALCYRGGSVIHKNETFALTWDAPQNGSQRNYWSQTRGYVEQFLRDVADSSGSLNSVYDVTTQYQDGGGRAQNASIFGGGCIDYGVVGSSACEYGSPTGAGHDYPANGCTPEGDSFIWPGEVSLNTVCLTDAQLQSEISTMVSQTGVIGRTQPGYTPLLTLLLPAGVEMCLDASHTICSVNGSLIAPAPDVTTQSGVSGATIPAGTYQVEVSYVTGSGEQLPSASTSVTTSGTQSTITIPSPPAASGVTGWYAYVTNQNGYTYSRQGGLQGIGSDLTLNSPPGGGAAPPSNSAYCSYHSEVNVGGTEVAYVVQPWVAVTGCDEPDAPQFPKDPTPQQAATDVGARLVSPLSQAEMAAITNPGMNGWVAKDGSEIDDGCVPDPNDLDSETLGASGQNPYYLQREFNNAGVLEFDPTTYFGCAPLVNLTPAFVAPSAVDQGDVVQLDGSTTDSTLIVPNSGYSWNFGDGTSATGPSVVHTYGKAGSYNVTLTATDRGGNTQTLTETIQVLGSNGLPAPPAPTSTGPGGSGSGGSSSSALSVHLLLMPQSLKNVLRTGIAVRVSSNKAANGIATVSITRAAARRAHLKVGKGPSVRIGIGTVSSITNGTITLRLHLSKNIAKKLTSLGHLNLTVRLALVASGNQQIAIDAAGKY